MADEPRKPKSLEDLKARLGKPAPNRPSRPPQPQRPIAAPKLAPVAPRSPFNKPAAPTAEAVEQDDPFATTAGPNVQEVRLVMDERPVEDSEVGKSRKLKLLIGMIVIALLGVAVGIAAGSSVGDRKLFNLALKDALTVKSAVERSATGVTEALKHVSAAYAAAEAGKGKKPKVDDEALAALRALKQPLEANAFSRKRYSALAPPTVDALFQYYNHVIAGWSDIRRVSAMAASKESRAALSASAKQSGAGTDTPLACIVAASREPVRCALTFIREKESDLEGGKLAVAERAVGQSVMKTLYTGGSLEDGNAMLIDSGRSHGVLGRQATLFDQYRASLLQLKRRLTLAETKQKEVLDALRKVEAEVKPVFAF